MPADDRLRAENCNRAEDGREPTIEPNKQKAIGIAELWSLRYLPAKHVSCWRRIRISATSFVLGLKSEAMIWRVGETRSSKVAGLPSLCLASSRIQFSVHTGARSKAASNAQATASRTS